MSQVIYIHQDTGAVWYDRRHLPADAGKPIDLALHGGDEGNPYTVILGASSFAPGGIVVETRRSGPAWSGREQPRHDTVYLSVVEGEAERVEVGGQKFWRVEVRLIRSFTRELLKEAWGR